MSAATEERLPVRERRPSTSAPIVDIQGSVGPAGISRPKHKRTFTGFGAGEIKSVEGEFVLVSPFNCMTSGGGGQTPCARQLPKDVGEGALAQLSWSLEGQLLSPGPSTPH